MEHKTDSAKNGTWKPAMPSPKLPALFRRSANPAQNEAGQAPGFVAVDPLYLKLYMKLGGERLESSGLLLDGRRV